MNEDQSGLFEDARHSDSDLLRVARERAEVAYLSAKRDGIRDPVVILWLHDDDATSHSPEIARRKEEAALSASLPLSIQAVERDEIRQGLVTINPACQSTFRDHPRSFPLRSSSGPSVGSRPTTPRSPRKTDPERDREVLPSCSSGFTRPHCSRNTARKQPIFWQRWHPHLKIQIKP